MNECRLCQTIEDIFFIENMNSLVKEYEISGTSEYLCVKCMKKIEERLAMANLEIFFSNTNPETARYFTMPNGGYG